MHPLFLLLLLQPAFSINILSFDYSPDGKISYKIIDRSIPLPELFTLCSHFKEDMIYGQSFFTIYGLTGDPWMTLSTWADGRVFLWLRINTLWVKIKDMPPHWMNSWIYVCIQADTSSGNFSVLVNEELPLFFNEVELTLLTPKNLKGKLFIGKSDDNYGQRQYKGEVANLNIYSGFRNDLNLLENPCEHDGDLVNKDTTWEVVGDVEERSEESRSVCKKEEIYRVAIPAKITWNSAVDMCHKLGGGNITESNNERDINHLVSLIDKLNSSCEYMWTPLSDKDVEGEFLSSVNGQLAKYLPWASDEPNGGDEQNHVVFDIKSKLLQDKHELKKYCSACDLHKNLVFTLIGLCIDTFFGK